MTDHDAYKLKKPVHFSYLDFRTQASRRHYCSEEVRLNRRLSHGVYLGTVPLMADAGGRLCLWSDDHVVDWLVHMRRLPAERMLDAMIRNRTLREDDLHRVLDKLPRFYREAPAVEHICLEPEPQFIDCLEFSRDFRILDPADELAFLALACERRSPYGT